MSEDRTFDGLALDAVAELKERHRDYPEDFGDPGDAIHEIADGWVPVYTYDRFQVLASSADVYGRDLELAGDTRDLVTLAGIAIYEALQEVLWDVWREMEAERIDAMEV